MSDAVLSVARDRVLGSPRDLLVSWLIPAGVLAALVAFFVLGHLPGVAGDTVALIHGAHTILYCLSHGIHSRCDRLPQFVPGSAATLAQHQIVEGAVSPYALLQYLPTLVLIKLGFTDLGVLRCLTALSLVAFCVILGVGTWLASRTGRRWAAPITAVMISTSPLLFYASSTFGEELAAMVIVLFVGAALVRSPAWLLAVLAFFACLTKETAFPIIALFGAAALWGTPLPVRALRRSHWTGLAAGIAFGLIVSGMFNWFRYRQVTNFTYGHAYEQVPGIARRLDFSVALWVSPNGGALWFWPLATILVLVAVALVVGLLRRRTRDLGRAMPAAAVVLAMLIITGTLASWWAPFGWIAWGPRLMMPTLPAAALIVLVVYAEVIERGLRRVLATAPRIIGVALAVTALGLAQVNVLDDNAPVGALFAPDAACPGEPSIGTQPIAYYRCINHYAWFKHLALLNSYQAASRLVGAIFIAGFAAAWFWLIWLAALFLRQPRPDRQPQVVVAGGAPQG